jgi:hypothetical protein
MQRVVSFMLWPLYHYGKKALYQLDNRLDELQSGHSNIEIKSLLLPRIEYSQAFHSQQILKVNSAMQDSLLMT